MCNERAVPSRSSRRTFELINYGPGNEGTSSSSSPVGALLGPSSFANCTRLVLCPMIGWFKLHTNMLKFKGDKTLGKAHQIKESRFVMETEDEVMIKQELDIAPTILQPRPAHHPHPPLNQVLYNARDLQASTLDYIMAVCSFQASASAPRSGISSEDGAASAFIDTTRTPTAQELRNLGDYKDYSAYRRQLTDGSSILSSHSYSLKSYRLFVNEAEAYRATISADLPLAFPFVRTLHQSIVYQTASRTVVEAAYCGKEYEVPSTANCELNMKTTDCYQGVLGECSNYEDTSAGRKEEGRCIYWPFQNGHLIRKILTHTRKKGYKCDQCQYSTSKTDNFKNHMRTHTGVKPYKCEQCEYSASRLHHLKNHMRTHTGEKPYKCEHCEYSASRITHLKNHMRIHTGDKPYKCKQCEYSASQLNNLKNHMRTHTCEKPYKCKQCEYSGSRITHLKNHMRIHTGDKPYKCEQCEYSACRLDNLKNHMHTHTHEKPYKCEQCKYSASRLHHLKNHMRTHTGEKPYKCEHCECSASRLDNLKNHMRTHTVE
ncbi:Zinc finger protein 436 [Eumeta japonica]|uniref:Zinc finger protein 436 n=1 Tax=Eumeta variegata TaxID=151549 RepID=A0A4C1Y9W6_EUMVA|nr:Zinc finger protein 436 [Eumeta japonica]